ncbi:hypothetical protein [Lysobacter sp. CA199]|uniref:hypothetical protein n=1 Tax=Lysobacter sp. CA199 TaxID=3455608 RepID=UPI003F8D60BA
MGNDNKDRKVQGGDTKQDDKARPPHGQGHQPLPGEIPSDGEGQAKRKHVQNADLPPGQGHQPLPGEDPPAEDKDDRR